MRVRQIVVRGTTVFQTPDAGAEKTGGHRTRKGGETGVDQFSLDKDVKQCV